MKLRFRYNFILRMDIEFKEIFNKCLCGGTSASLENIPGKEPRFADIMSVHTTCH